MSRLKVGIVGCGIGRSHLAAFRALPDLYSVVALCDLDRERAESLAREGEVPRVTARLDDLLALDLDIVDVCTPSSLHAGQAIAALRSGRHVIVEKPLARSLAEVDELAETARRAGRQVAPVFQYRFGNGFRRLMHLKAKGLVGAAYVATVETHWRRTAAYYANPWRGRWESELGGCLVTHAIHAHDLLTEAIGPIASVFARTATRVNPIETEDCAAAVLTTGDGALANLSVTLGATRETSRLRFCFDGLTVESGGGKPYEPGAEPWHFMAADEAAQRRIDDALADFVPSPDRWTGQFLELHAALTGGKPMPVSLSSARASIELATAAYHSVATGEVVALPIGPSHPFYGGWLAAMREKTV